MDGDAGFARAFLEERLRVADHVQPVATHNQTA
jgi:hypothetical protein